MDNTMSLTITQVNSSTRKRGITISRLIKLIGNECNYIFIFLTCMVIALPLPFPPGFSVVLAIPSIILSFQNLFFRKKIFLPRYILKLRISKHFIRNIDKLSKKYLILIEKLTKQRFEFLSKGVFKVINDCLLLIFCIATALPVPFLCMIPSWAGLFLSMGLMIKDGFLIIFSWLVGFTGIHLIYFAVKAILTVKNVVPL